ncbi:MAG: class I SAM-dependent methyltransferase [Anaerolineae bacterium]|nr:class I SAM-dependent methyltransferase [Anaerolineae bacterium]
MGLFGAHCRHRGRDPGDRLLCLLQVQPPLRRRGLSAVGQSPDNPSGAAREAAQPVVDPERAIRLGHPSYIWRAGQERRLGLVRRYVSLEGKRILDIGCGLGMYTEAFRRYTPDVFGTEVEHERARHAAARAACVVQAVGEALPFRSNAFDVVYSHEVLEHVSDDRQVVREAVRVTRPGGAIVIYVPNRLWPFETHGVYWRGTYHFGNIPLVNYLPDPVRNRLAWHVRVYTRRSLRALFEGLPVQIQAHRTVYPGFDNVVRRFPTAGRVIRALSYRLETWPIADRFGLSHLLVVHKRVSPSP